MSTPNEWYREYIANLGQPQQPPRPPRRTSIWQRIRFRTAGLLRPITRRPRRALIVASGVLVAAVVAANLIHGLRPVGSDMVPSGRDAAPAAAHIPDSSTGGTFAPLGSQLTYRESDDYGTTTGTATIDVRTVGTYSRGDAQSGGDNPQNGTFRVFAVTVKVTAGTVTDLDSDSFRWETPAGEVFDEGNGASDSSGRGIGDWLSYKGAAVGQTYRGQLVFDVPAGGGRLEITEPDSSVAGGWTVQTSGSLS